jgi:hypothetical protein
MIGLRDTFDHTYEKGGFTYVSWSQVADRLDEAAPGWSFTIRQLGEDYCWGQLTIDGRTFDNIGYAENASADWKKEPLKDAVSDCLKRCAALAGVARYLYDKPESGPVRPSNGHRAPAPVAAPPRSTTAVPDSLDDYDFANLSPVRPGTLAIVDRAEGTMWSKELFERAESAGIDKKVISATAKKMYGQDKWKVTDLTDGERFALAVELELA